LEQLGLGETLLMLLRQVVRAKKFPGMPVTLKLLTVITNDRLSFYGRKT
jgi:hypothetical protein